MDNPLSISDFIELHKELFNDSIFIEGYSGEKWTYAEFSACLSSTTSILSTWMGNGDCRFCIALPNTPEFLLILFGGISCGATAVNLNLDLSVEEFRFRLKDANVSYIITLPEIKYKLDAILNDLNIKSILICENNQDLVSTEDHVLFKRDLRKSTEPRVEKHLQNPAFLQYTGGTTGLTKAAMISHSNVLSCVELMGQYLDQRLVKGQETFVVTFPFYHVFSIVFQVLMAMRFGARIILYPYVRDFPVLKNILLRQDFSVIVGVHTLYKMMLQDEDISRLKFPNTKIFIAGAEHVQPITKERWKASTGHSIIEGYGLTETSALAVMSCLDDIDNDFDAIGKPLPGTDIMLLSEEGLIIEDFDTPGEIIIKGPQVVEGYWNRPEENKATFFEGWLRTGDIAIRKSNGQYKMVDRKKDMINVSGFNVYPNEVEAVVMSYPGIIDCAAVAIPDEKSGERVAVFYVANRRIDELELHLLCRDELSAYKVPVRYIALESIPKSPIGKTLRRDLRVKLQKT